MKPSVWRMTSKRKQLSKISSNFWTRRPTFISQGFQDWSQLWNGKQERALNKTRRLEGKAGTETCCASREAGAESMEEKVWVFSFVCVVGLPAPLPLMLMAWEGSSASLSYLLQLLLISRNCLSCKIAVFQLKLSCLLGVALCLWSTPANTSIFRDETVCEGWVGYDSPSPSPSGSSHQALNTSN